MNTATNLIDDLRILEEPRPWYHWAILAGVVLFAALLSWFLKKRVSSSNLATGPQAAHAHEDALAALARAKVLLSPANSRQYAMEVSGIVRRYIENRFAITAPARTTEEFLFEAKSSPRLEPKFQSLLEEFLKSCDFLKFAKGIGELTELEHLHRAAVRFVSETRPLKPALASIAPSSDKEASV